MARIIINGIRPWDGDYDLQTDRAFNAREWQLIKRQSGYLPLTVKDGFAGGDPNLMVALAVIALCRAGKIDRDQGPAILEQFSEIPFDNAAITLVGDEVAPDEIPLDLTTEPAELSPTS